MIEVASHNLREVNLKQNNEQDHINLSTLTGFHIPSISKRNKNKICLITTCFLKLALVNQGMKIRFMCLIQIS